MYSTLHVELHALACNFVCMDFSCMQFRVKLSHAFLAATQCSKIRKKCNCKNAKSHYLHFQNWQKINFCTRKKFQTTKNPVFTREPVAPLAGLGIENDHHHRQLFTFLWEHYPNFMKIFSKITFKNLNYITDAK